MKSIITFSILFFTLILSQSCQEKEVKTITYDRLGVSFNYPSNWTKIKDRSIVFGIENTNAVIDSNILLTSMDSTISKVKGYHNFDEFCNGMAEILNNKKGYQKVDQFQDVQLNQVPCKRIAFQVGEKIETNYLFEYNDKFYSIIVTELSQNKSLETQEILSSLALTDLGDYKIF